MAVTIKHVIQGNYLPHGVCRLFGDESLNNLLGATFTLFVRCSHQTSRGLLSYSKVATQLFYWLDNITRELTRSYMSTKLPVEMLVETLCFIRQGICCSVDSTVVASACTALEQILDYLMELVDQVKNNASAKR